MPERPRFRPPKNWPSTLPTPHDPELPVRALAWLREVVPSEAWRVDALSVSPWAATIQIMGAVDRLIDSLRSSYRQLPELYAGILGDGLTRAVLAAHTAEAERLNALRLQIADVESALASMGSAGTGRLG